MFYLCRRDVSQFNFKESLDLDLKISDCLSELELTLLYFGLGLEK